VYTRGLTVHIPHVARRSEGPGARAHRGLRRHVSGECYFTVTYFGAENAGAQ
jgi:hypothetical protein